MSTFGRIPFLKKLCQIGNGRSRIGNMQIVYVLIEELDMKIMLSVGNPQAVIQYVSQAAPPFLYFLDVDLNSFVCVNFYLMC